MTTYPDLWDEALTALVETGTISYRRAMASADAKASRMVGRELSAASEELLAEWSAYRQAYAAGGRAHDHDAPRVPAADPQVMSLLEGSPLGSTYSVAVMAAWTAGYAAKADAAAERVLAGAR